MTKEETSKLLDAIQNTYPNFKPQDRNGMLNTWSGLLLEQDFNEVSVGLKRYILSDSSGFAPSIGQIIAQIPRAYEMGVTEAQAKVRIATRNGTYGAEEEFAKLSPEIQEAVGSPANLRAWAKMDSSEFETVALSHFARSYRAVIERKKHEDMMPENLKVQLEADKPLQIGGE